MVGREDTGRYRTAKAKSYYLLIINYYIIIIYIFIYKKHVKTIINR